MARGASRAEGEVGIEVEPLVDPLEQGVPAHAEIDLHPVLRALEQALIEGDYDGAKSKLAGQPSLGSTILALPETDETRMRASALLAEVHAHFGENEAARDLMDHYALASDRFLASTLSARQKLQLAEHHYWLLEDKQAVSIATTILGQCRELKDTQGTGEALYYLARYHSRQNVYGGELEQCVMQALEAFHRSRLDDAALRWRTGLLFRVRGTARWHAGRLEEAQADLLHALWLLKRAKSRVHVGDAHHSLGRVLRSLGPTFYEEAIDEFEEALRDYDGHDLNRARALTDLARTQLAMKHFEESEANLLSAQGICTSHEPHLGVRGKRAQGLWLRQKQEVLVWLSWHYQEAPSLNLKAAHDCATKAVALKTSVSGEDHIEAQLTLGHCELRRGDYKEAGRQFELARDWADKLETPKLQVYANLSLAELACHMTDADIQSAEKHFQRATRLLEQHPNFYHFLQEKAKQVRARIDDLVTEQDCFLLRPQDLHEEPPDDYTRKTVLDIRARKWAVHIARQGRSLEGAAAFLGITPNTVREIKEKYNAWAAARKPPDQQND